jgi:GT2 family glycosyltransferase/glycosyltransferase involved in cell wall biosynthesis
MTIPPKVSVILTSYNSAKYLRESIESALNQTYKDFELIIWHDESPDDSWDIITSYTDRRIRVFTHQPNGFAAHFQEAIADVARGEYIAVHHSDDAWEPEKLEQQVALLDAHPEVGAVFTKVKIIGEDSEPFENTSHFYYKIFDQPNRTRHEWLNHFFYRGNALCHPSVMVRKKCFAECGTYRHPMAQANDMDLWVRVCMKYEIHILPDKLTRFRVRANEMNVSGDRPDAHIRGALEQYEILPHFQKITDPEEFVKVFPNTLQYFKPEGYDLDFALAMAALDPSTPIYKKLFGLQLLFDALNDIEREKRLRELYGFGYREFFVLAGELDVFSTALIPSLVARLTEKERENQELLAQVSAPSLATSLIARSRPLRLRIAPPGSRGDKLLKRVYQGLRTWKKEGFRSAYRKAAQRISRQLSVKSPHTPLVPNQVQKEAAADSLLDLRALSDTQPLPSLYDVIILAKGEWKSHSQGLEEIAKRFAQDGQRVFYISTALNKGIKTKVRSIEGNIFEVQWSGPATKTVDSEPLSEQRQIAISKVFDALRNELGIADAVCLVESAVWESLAFSLHERFNWKILYDPYTTDYTSEKMRQAHENLIQNSDLVITGSISLLKELEKHNRNGLLIPTPSMEQDSATQDTWEHFYMQIKQRVPALFSKASIIIVTYNNLEYTRLCLQSIYEKTIYPNFEVIVVDNASSDQTPEFLRSFEAEHEHIQVIYNTVNKGFASANNLGIARASGDVILLLNNDTLVTKVWLSRLVNYLRDQTIGLVGSVSNGVSNEAHVEMQFIDSAALEVFAAKRAKELANQLTSIKMLAMYCMAGRREVFQQIGPLDEQFGIGMFEDDDYSLRARQVGYRIVVAEDVFIHHFGRSGFKLLGDERYLALFAENRNKFEAKWNITWEQHVSGSLTENRRFTADLQNVLDQYPEVPGVVIFPPTIGWNISLFQRPHQLARTFANKGYLVFFCTEAPVDDIKGFKQVSPSLYLANVPWGVFDLIERPVVFTLPYNREFSFQLRQPIVVYEVIDDLDVFPGDQSELKKNHNVSLKEADLILVTADRLMEQVKEIRADAILCPNAVELDHFARAGGPGSLPRDLASIIKADRPVIGYYGALARWFDYDLVRQAAQEHIDWDFVIIGPDHDHTLLESNLLSIPNVHWLGPRDYSQLPEYLRQFSVATIPFLVNTITLATSPIKLFEYMAAGKPIVTSDLPECRKYPGVFVAHNAKEYIAHLEHALTLVHDGTYIQGLHQTAQENTWEARINQIIHALEFHQHSNSPMELRR